MVFVIQLFLFAKKPLFADTGKYFVIFFIYFFVIQNLFFTFAGEFGEKSRISDALANYFALTKDVWKTT